MQDLHGIGCEARVDAMALAEGAIGTVVHLVATGVRRFRLDGVDDAAGTPFTTGLVTWLARAAGRRRPGGRRPRRAGRCASTRPTSSGLGAEAEPGRGAARSSVAYRVAERMVLDPTDRQRVLEGADAATRLRTVLALLRREAAIVGRFGALPTPPDPGGASLN